MTLEERLTGVYRLSTPVWVFDVERGRIVWTNQAGLDLWRSPGREELFARDFSDMSEATRTRHQGYLPAFREGRAVREEWTWYPRGEPLTLLCTISGIELDDGRVVELCEAVIKEGVDPSPLRGVEALRHTSVMVALVTPSGEILMQNPAAARVFGEASGLSGWFTDQEVVEELLRRSVTGEVVKLEAQVRTLAGPRWHAVEARLTRDPVTGKAAVLIHHLDVTERRATDAVLEQQRREILNLSAPILEVGERALAVPVIGALDRDRSSALSETLLARVVEQRAEAVILDLTGATAASAPDLLALARTLKLLGTRPIVTGVRPALAQALMATGTGLDGVVLLRNLRQGIAACVRPGER